MESFKAGNLLVKIADKEEEFKQIFRLRYEELLLSYDSSKNFESKEDKDEYDEVCDHLIIIDTTNNLVVGTYRLIKKDQLKQLKTFLTETEFDITPLKKYEILEVGRAVVKEEYRNGAAISMLWKGVILYALSEKIDFMIGTASFHGVDVTKYQNAFSYLHDKYLSSEDIRCYAKEDSSSKLRLLEEYDLTKAKEEMPPLVKGYLALGATIGDGIYLDKPFNSSDVLIVLKIKDINERYLKRYLK